MPQTTVPLTDLSPPEWPPDSFDARVQNIIAEMRRLGHDVTVVSRKRTAAEQAKLFAQGRSSPGRIVTEKSGRPGDESRHQLGLAADLAFRDPVTGKVSYSEQHPWAVLGDLAKRQGLEWGGDWTTLKDRPHVQMPTRGRLTRGQRAPGEEIPATPAVVTTAPPPPAAPSMPTEPPSRLRTLAGSVLSMIPPPRPRPVHSADGYTDPRSVRVTDAPVVTSTASTPPPAPTTVHAATPLTVPLSQVQPITVSLDQLGGQAPPPLSASHGATPPPPPKTWGATIAGIPATLGLDPRTREGRQNLAGAAGSLATLAITRSPTVASRVGLAARTGRLALPVAGAAAGGAGAELAEQAAGGQPPQPRLVAAAARDQALLETTGQAVAWPIRAGLRRLAASGISKKISQGLDEAIAAVSTRLKGHRPAVSPAQAGQMTDKVIAGPAKSVKDQLGRDVEAAAATGPTIPVQPLKDRLIELSQQVTPMASHAQAPTVKGFSPAQMQALVKQNPALLVPPDHPLPTALARVEEVLAQADEITFEDAHKIKRLLDDVVNWDSPAKKQVQQITKGFRQTLREVMASHQPYNEATEAYGTVAKLFDDVGVNKLSAHIRKNPGEVVGKIKWQNPDSAKIIREITSLAPDQAGKQEGEAAFNAIRAAWTNENLVSLGPHKMAGRMEQIEASNAGQEFIQTFYGDPQGQTVWGNLKLIAGALREKEAAVKAFAQTDLARATEPAGMLRDLGYTALPGHGVTKLGAASRLLWGKGSSATELLQWASYSPERTQRFIREVLVSPNLGVAIANFGRWASPFFMPERPMPSHETAGPPPAPRSTPPPPRPSGSVR